MTYCERIANIPVALVSVHYDFHFELGVFKLKSTLCAYTTRISLGTASVKISR